MRGSGNDEEGNMEMKQVGKERKEGTKSAWEIEGRGVGDEGYRGTVRRGGDMEEGMQDRRERGREKS